MARKCSICFHPERTNIDDGLARNQSLREIAERFSLSLSAVSRHYRLHLAPGLARKTYSRPQGQPLLYERAQALYGLGIQVLEHPERAENPIILQTIQRLEALCKTIKFLAPAPVANPPIDPDLPIRLLDEVLQRYPEARAEVIEKLRQLRRPS